MWCPSICGGVASIVVVELSVECVSGMYAGSAQRLGDEGCVNDGCACMCDVAMLAVFVFVADVIMWLML